MTTTLKVRSKEKIVPPYIPPEYETFQRKLRKGSPNVNIITVPKDITKALNWKTGDTIRFSLDEINKRVILQAEHKSSRT
jgi:hypothetical protein